MSVDTAAGAAGPGRPVSGTSGFEVTHASGPTGARAGVLSSPHGRSETPCFLPIATNGSLRAMTFEEAAACGTTIIMANAWHLTREMDPAAMRRAGGVHALMGWNGTLFTDSGGYQVFSLRDSSDIDDAGVRLGADDGSLTPERVVRMQKALGSDVMMVLDDCPPFPCTKERAAEAMRRTSVWAEQSMRAHREIPSVYGRHQALWGIVQGGEYDDLREQSVDDVAQYDFDGYGIGGLSIGMPREIIRRMTSLQCARLPVNRARHLLGVGLPPQILDGIEDGADTFDCVLPIRKAQRGYVYTTYGELAYKDVTPTRVMEIPLDPLCTCATCKAHPRQALGRLFRSDKAQAGRLAAIHNVHFYHQMLRRSRDAILQDRFPAFKAEFLAKYDARANRRA